MKPQSRKNFSGVCESFERALQSGEVIRIEDYLTRASREIQDLLFRELLAIELEARLPHDRSSRFADYRARFPARSVEIERVTQEVLGDTPVDDTVLVRGDEPPEREVVMRGADILYREVSSRYELQEEIARGGMGAIFKGRDTNLGRELAIKVLLETHKDKHDVVQLFVEEAQIGGQLNVTEQALLMPRRSALRRP